MEALLVIPTYNERDNIERVLGTVFGLNVDACVLVVDDNSPDGTGDLVASLAEKDDRINLLRRPGKMGLGSAYIAGFKWALANTDARFVFEMDADFSHDPAAVPEFLAAAQEADLVIGSRYLDGITVMNWPLSRLILSVGANIYTRVVTGMPLRDATGGFKCFRREVLGSLPLDDIKSDGYSFQIEVNHYVWKRGFRIKEIPIVFVDRVVGTSKMSRRIIFEAAFLVWKLRFDSIFRRNQRHAK
jgi:dolichol-phosphate mannosyltransferase